jgi:hypothetical protein
LCTGDTCSLALSLVRQMSKRSPGFANADKGISR